MRRTALTSGVHRKLAQKSMLDYMRERNEEILFVPFETDNLSIRKFRKSNRYLLQFSVLYVKMRHAVTLQTEMYCSASQETNMENAVATP